jgi:thiamine biosynthesis lipoprotein
MTAASVDTATGAAVWEALGTTVVLRVCDPAALEQAVAILERELDVIDRVASRFRSDSELERLNARAGHLTAISDRLYEALAVALRAARITGGLLDPTLGAALIEAGYDRDRTLLEPDDGAAAGAAVTPATPDPAAPLARWSEVGLVSRFEHIPPAVWVPAGVRLDLGATAKALTADRAAALIAEQTGSGVLVSLGGDIATAGEAPELGWTVHVTDDHRSDLSAPGQTVTIRADALATSSTTALRWSHHGRSMHHILDPRTGRPADSPWRTVSVTAGNCVDANIASTAAIVIGAAAPAWLESHGLDARLVAHDGTAHTVGGWPLEAA